MSLNDLLIIKFEEHLRNKINKLFPKIMLPEISKNIKDADSNIVKYFLALMNYNHNKVSLEKRTIYFSNKLLNNPLYLKYKERIDLIDNFIKNGDNEINNPQNKFLSKRVEFLFNNKEKYEKDIFLDKMLYEWDIRHFHIGNEIRIDELLFVILDKKNAYFIDVKNHNSFCDTDLLEIVADEWEFLLDYFKGITGSELSEQQIKNLRDQNVNFTPLVNGKALMHKTFFNLSGIPFNLRRDIDFTYRIFEDIANVFNDKNSDAWTSINKSIENKKLDYKISFSNIRFEQDFSKVIIIDEKNKIDFHYPLNIYFNSIKDENNG